MRGHCNDEWPFPERLNFYREHVGGRLSSVGAECVLKGHAMLLSKHSMSERYKDRR